MLFDVLPELAKWRIVLASGSPRRRELLAQLQLDFEVIPSTFDEASLDKTQFAEPALFVEENARRKAAQVFASLKSPCPLRGEARVANQSGSGGSAGLVVIGSDTVVVDGNIILEKPKSAEHAVSMLSQLSGRLHHVVSAVAIIYQQSGPDPADASGPASAQTLLFHQKTAVLLAELDQELIKAYVATGEPMDKAGSYGIQGLGGCLVTHIEGDYYTVVGLPLHRVCAELRALVARQCHGSPKQ
mmetsp:Transcript_82201/g.190876  ORF Transcript_82201/g.190876 Transcript_82201/m.190876 type:complete len:244 (+) Transcript_82201:76-807(+)